MPKACTAESGARQSRLKRSSLTLPIWKSSSCLRLGLGVGVGLGLGLGLRLGLGLGLGELK